MTKSKVQKKKRNNIYIPQNKRKCSCGSGNEYGSCCLAYDLDGSLIKKMDGRFNDVHTIIIFEISSILQNMCIESKFLDKLYSSLLDMFSLSDESLNACQKHTYDLKKGIGCQKNSNTYQVNDFDHRLHFYVRCLFISGGVVKDALCQFSNEIGFNIMFLFGNENNKDFDKKLDKLIGSFKERGNAMKLKDFILKQKVNWLTNFILNRDKIEHGKFEIPSIEYLVNKDDKLLPQFPTIDGIICSDLFHRYPRSFFNFSRDIIIFLLSELAYREEFMGGTYRGTIIPVKEERLPFGELNKEKIIYKFTTQDKKTGEIFTVNFSRNCPKNKKQNDKK